MTSMISITPGQQKTLDRAAQQSQSYGRIPTMNLLQRFLSIKPAFVRLLNAVFAVAVAFEVIDISAEQFGIVVLAVEALFQYLSNLAFAKDVEDLAAAQPTFVLSD